MFIVLVDDHPLFTESLKMVLLQQPTITKVKTFNEGSEFLFERLNPAPDIIILDLMMPGMDGMKILEVCKAEYKSNSKIIILTFIMNVQTIKQAIRAGADGFISKNTSIDELVEAINEVQSGNQYISKKLRDEMLKSMFKTEQVIFHLSPREKDVLQRICKGNTIKEIAFDLELSYHTVQYYSKTIMAKFKVKRTVDLIVFAMLHGFYIPDINGQDHPDK